MIAAKPVFAPLREILVVVIGVAWLIECTNQTIVRFQLGMSKKIVGVGVGTWDGLFSARRRTGGRRLYEYKGHPACDAAFV